MPDQNIDYYSRNQQWVSPGQHIYTTDLGNQEPAFRQWVKQNNIPFDPNDPNSDYDMRGYWKASQNPAIWKELQAAGHVPSDMLPGGTKINPNDGKPHFPDWWKTPYHQSFSAESQWADPTKAPRWNEKDQLVLPSGQLVYDERKARVQRMLHKFIANIQLMQQVSKASAR